MSELDDFDFNYDDDMQALNEIEENGVSVGPQSKSVNQNVLPSPQLSEIFCSTSKQTYGGLTDATNQFRQRYVSTPFPTSFSNDRNQVQSGENVRTKKRRLELDLFGDINDLNREDDEVDANTKKLKSEEERDLELIATILNARKRLQSYDNDNRNDNFLKRLDFVHTHKIKNLSRSLPKWPFVKMIKSDQDRVYVRFHSEDFETNQIKEVRQSNMDQAGLFGDKRDQIWDEAKKLINNKLQNADRSYDLSELSFRPTDNSLWVEKYKPKKYIELLSDESCNRNLLKWIKLWDKVVFSSAKTVQKPYADQMNNNANTNKPFNTFNKKTGRFEQRNTQLKTDLDEFNCPLQKIVLLAGEPGVGKTTMAHNIAKQAGYQPVEVNASDDRTIEAFKLALENGTQMQSVFSSDKRPNCLILDEIDGAPTVSIEFLVRYISGMVKTKSGKQGNPTKFVLKRPIICICNDLYALSLRSLRAIAYVINVPPTDDTRLVTRLYQICLKQKIKTNTSTLYSLVEKAGNDIR